MQLSRVAHIVPEACGCETRVERLVKNRAESLSLNTNMAAKRHETARCSSGRSKLPQ